MCVHSMFWFSHPTNTVLHLVVTRTIVLSPTDQQDVYPDIRNDYKQSEVAVDYNAGLTGAAAGLAAFLTMGDLAVCGAGRAWVWCCLSSNIEF